MSKKEITVDERLDNIERLLRLNKPVFNLKEAALFCGLEESYMYKLTHLRAVPHFVPRGKLLCFSREELIPWLLKNRVKTTQELELEANNYLLTKNSRK